MSERAGELPSPIFKEEKMSKYTDISARLDDAQPILKLSDEEEYPVDDDKNNVLKMNASMAEAPNDIEAFYIAVEMLIGTEAMAAIEKKHPGITSKMSTLRVLFHGVMAAIGGISIEEAEKRFRRGF